MRTTPSRGRNVGPAAAAATAADSRAAVLPETDPGTRLLLTVWPLRGGGWRAQVELADGATHVFDSPLELARFLAQWPDRPTPQAEPAASTGLR